MLVPRLVRFRRLAAATAVAGLAVVGLPAVASAAPPSTVVPVAAVGSAVLPVAAEDGVVSVTSRPRTTPLHVPNPFTRSN